jgi:regulator of protease activity HflC (stomatin/prohibitin superfamily)
MVEIAGRQQALQLLRHSLRRFVVMGGGVLLLFIVLYASCTARVLPNEFGVEQKRLGTKTGIEEKVYMPGLYFLGPGETMHTFSREINVLEMSAERDAAMQKAHAMGPEVQRRVDEYFDNRSKVLGETTHRVIDALRIQTSDGYSVLADVSLLYSIEDPVKVAKDFGWGTLYVDSFVIQTFRNGVLATLGKMNAESFYDESARVAAIEDAEKTLKERFAARGFHVERLLLRNYVYADTYEKSLQSKKVAVQLTEKNRKESVVNEETAKLKQIEAKGNATITIAESQVNANIAKIRAEAELYSSQVHAKADQEYGFAAAEAKRLKAEALTYTGGHYVVALETAKMFENIDAAVMTPEQYVAFVRNAWSLLGLSPGGGGK